MNLKGLYIFYRLAIFSSFFFLFFLYNYAFETIFFRMFWNLFSLTLV